MLLFSAVYVYPITTGSQLCVKSGLIPVVLLSALDNGRISLQLQVSEDKTRNQNGEANPVILYFYELNLIISCHNLSILRKVIPLPISCHFDDIIQQYTCIIQNRVGTESFFLLFIWHITLCRIIMKISVNGVFLLRSQLCFD